MTINEIIAHVNMLTPNMIEDSTKVKWLGDLDLILYRDVFLSHHGTDEVAFSGYDANTDLDTELLIPAPYSDIYRWYIEMMICDINGEITKYNNAANKYNTALVAVMDYYNRSYKPKGVRNIRLI